MVTFPDLAAHVFFAETGQPIPKKAQDGNPFLGTFQDRAVYLLWSREGASKPGAHRGNILSVEMLAALPSPGDGFSGERIVYADGCTVSRERLNRDNILFKQVPYRVAGN
jgi:adenine-specific DNA-methyltransferase